MKLWGGRFSESQDALAAALNNSLAFDYRLGEVDVRASMAWARALGRAGILPGDEVSQIIDGLETVQSEITTGSFETQPSDEDIHTAVERRLVELVGPVGGKLHTGRSRNDQVATDFRMWLLEAIEGLDQNIAMLQAALVVRAEADMGIVLPGYTHLQQAQPILLSHWWLGHFWPLQRDRDRLADARPWREHRSQSTGQR
jgi:argininosuccinate lyase